jgi:hypothetical protein
MNILVLAHRFFLFGGAVLLVIALLQLRLRLRAKDQGSGPRLLDATMVRVVLFASVGVLAILVGAGVIPMAQMR